MGTNNVKYFLQGSNAAIIYDPVANVVTAQAIDGVFATAKKEVTECLQGMGYREVTKEALEDLGFAVPKHVDKTDYTVRDSKRYTMF
jgi:hypothetical protein